MKVSVVNVIYFWFLKDKTVIENLNIWSLSRRTLIFFLFQVHLNFSLMDFDWTVAVHKFFYKSTF